MSQQIPQNFLRNAPEIKSSEIFVLLPHALPGAVLWHVKRSNLHFPYLQFIITKLAF